MKKELFEEIVWSSSINGCIQSHCKSRILYIVVMRYCTAESMKDENKYELSYSK